ncbi:cytochrome P450 CYP12A2-like [Colias croceus]|uniref:cytochrome P450 CYP12A2-like n=1 Tax=Colias crocea TaxID=72248 RepID=UPI001E27F0BE|nr:cytochrome P450 CYP12A2-like [Colias croceus]
MGVVRTCVVNRILIRNIATNAALGKADVESLELKSWKEIPGPTRTMSLISNYAKIFFPKHKQAATEKPMFDMLHEMYGPIVKVDGLFGARSMVILLDAKASEEVLRGENVLPVRPGFDTLELYRRNKNKATPDSPTGLVSDHGEVWKKFRSAVNPILMQPKTIRLYRNTLREVADETITRIKSKRNASNMIEDFDLEMNLWSLESIGAIALGKRLHCLDPTLPNTSPVRQLIQTVRDIFVLVEKLEFRPNIWRYISTPTYRQIMLRYKELDRLTTQFIKEAKNELKTRDKKPNEERGVLEKLLEIDDKMATIMASDMLFAGVDTTSNSVITTLYLLANNPEKQNKLREELLSDSERRPYLKACIKESMRMLPVVMGNIRKISKDYNLLGYKIPKNTDIFFIHQYLSMLESHFPRPTEFIPERWIADKADPLYYRNADPFAFNPFGFGARSCIGRRIAELEMETFISTAIQKFRLDWIGPPIKTKLGGINYVVKPFNFVFNDI